MLYVTIMALGLQLAFASAEPTITISIYTERYMYTGGEVVTVSGRILDSSKAGEKGEPQGIMSKVQIEVIDPANNRMLYQGSTVSNTGGFFSDSGFRSPDVRIRADFEITARAEDVNGTTLATARTKIISVPAFDLNIFLEPAMVWVLATPIAFIALLSLMVWPLEVPGGKETGTNKRDQLIAITPLGFVVWQFLLLSLLTASPIISLLSFPRQIGADAPVGLVADAKIVGDRVDTAWVVNIGGTFDGLGYTGGLQIPVYVVVLGLLGAYLAYLYKIPSLLEEAKKVTQSKEFKYKMTIHSIANLAYFVLGPILAVALWLVLSQVGIAQSPPYTLALASLTVGLLTKQVTALLIARAEDILKQAGTKESKKSPQIGKETENETIS